MVHAAEERHALLLKVGDLLQPRLAVRPRDRDVVQSVTWLPNPHEHCTVRGSGLHPTGHGSRRELSAGSFFLRPCSSYAPSQCSPSRKPRKSLDITPSGSVALRLLTVSSSDVGSVEV